MSTLLRLLVPCLLAAAALPAARADDPPRPAEPPAALSVSYQPTGRAAVQLALTGRDGPPGIRVEPLTAVLQAVVGPGAPPAEVELAPPVYAWSVRDCPLAAVGDNVAQGALDLRPLLSELAVQGYRRLHVTVTF